MIIIMGVSGSGKGTQSDLLAAKLGYTHISSGDLFRNHATGEQRNRMLQGLYLTDDDVFAMFESAIKAIADPNQIILDGIPRTQGQATWLMSPTNRKRWKIEAIFALNASHDVVQKRMHERGRIDDTDDAISSRINEFAQQTVPVIAFMKQQGLPLFEIDGSQSIEAVQADMLSHLH